MSHAAVHALCAVPFALAGEWGGAVASLLPDVTWVPQEWRFRRSDARRWEEWVRRPGALHPAPLLAYRLAHSWVLVGAAFIALHLSLRHTEAHVGAWALGYLSHLLLDLFTHEEPMLQRPLFPFSNWRWTWTIAR